MEFIFDTEFILENNYWILVGSCTLERWSLWVWDNCHMPTLNIGFHTWQFLLVLFSLFLKKKVRECNALGNGGLFSLSLSYKISHMFHTYEKKMLNLDKVLTVSLWSKL